MQAANDVTIPGDAFARATRSILLRTRADRLGDVVTCLGAAGGTVHLEAHNGATSVSAEGVWVGTSTARLMIAVLVGLEDAERDPIRTRIAEGRSRAKARGRHMRRPPKLTPQQQAEARRRRAEGATLKELAKSYNVGSATISRLGT